jgi:alpha-amylase/alpha-mannosidase (GH57 family)
LTMQKNKYVCIHGHFYQPPRESAWLEVIELQESAAPFHDWNERVNFECYARNTAARINGERDFIRKIVNNYAQISFNFGPTLLSWLESADPTTYHAILDADRQSWDRFGGHGNAMAQAYNHTIMPLSNERDKVTQVRWGIADFEHRFGRKPEGMWLPEAAVDTASLEVLAAHGIAFTVLAPRQAKAVRKIGTTDWTPLPSENVDTRRAYLCKLPSGKTISLFFYDGNTAKDVAFQGLLNSGAAFGQRMSSVFDADDEPQLSHIATDGESYGHHHGWGEMALAFCLDFIEEKTPAALTNYGQFLEKHPPVYEVQIHENSSWSCAHGVERWRSDCGCNTGGQPGWNQAWRGPLRDALDWLHDELTLEYETSASQWVKDIWVARDEYIAVILDRSQENVERFIEKHARRVMTKKERINLLRLLEIQRQCQLMYTSCAWFFSEVSGIETSQVLQYALRATYHHYNATGVSLAPQFIERLERVPSNSYASAADSFRANVLPSQLTLTGVAMHYAASSIFEDYEDTATFLHFSVENEVFERIPAGGQRLALGRTTVVSKLTYSEKHFSFAVLYLGQQHMVGSISLDMPQTTFNQFQLELSTAFRSANLGDVISLIQSFGDEKFSFKNLFKDEKLKIYKQILANSYPAVESAIKDYYEDNYQLMNGMLRDDMPVPGNWKGITQFVIEQSLHRFFENGRLSVRELRHLAGEHQLWGVQFIDLKRLKFVSGERIFAELKKIGANGEVVENLRRLSGILEVLAQLEILPELWKSQNLFYQLSQKHREENWAGVAPDWKKAFLELGRWLKVDEG